MTLKKLGLTITMNDPSRIEANLPYISYYKSIMQKERKELQPSVKYDKYVME